MGLFTSGDSYINQEAPIRVNSSFTKALAALLIQKPSESHGNWLGVERITVESEQSSKHAVSQRGC